MTIKLLFNYKNLDQKLRQIKLLQTLFGLGLKEAKYAVDCGEILQCCKAIFKFLVLYLYSVIN